MKNIQININHNYQLNQFQNSLNLKVSTNGNINNEMIDYGIIIINKAYNLMNKGDDRAKYISDSFDSKYPKKGKTWNCLIMNFIAGSISSNYSIIYSTGKEEILIFAD